MDDRTVTLIENQRRYEAFYWGYDPDNKSTTMLYRKEVTVPDETFKAMTSKDGAKYYRFIVEDGADFYIAADCLHSLNEKIGQTED